MALKAIVFGNGSRTVSFEFNGGDSIPGGIGNAVAGYLDGDRDVAFDVVRSWSSTFCPVRSVGGNLAAAGGSGGGDCQPAVDSGCLDDRDVDVGRGEAGVASSAQPSVSAGTCAVGGELDAEAVKEAGRGRWFASNKRKKEKKKKDRLVPEWRRKARPVGFCETVLTQSSCPSYGQAVSDAEREAKESLAKRRAAENALQEKLAKMKLADLEDEQKCQEYATLKRQRVIQWTNEATAKSQQSLDKCKSIDPGSSSSQFEIRKTVKELEDLKLQHAHLIKVFHDAVPDAAKIIAMTKLPGTESMERYQLEGEFIGGWGDDHSISS